MHSNDIDSTTTTYQVWHRGKVVAEYADALDASAHAGRLPGYAYTKSTSPVMPLVSLY